MIKRLKDKIIPPRIVEPSGNGPYDLQHYNRKISQFAVIPSTRSIAFLGDSRIEGGMWEELLDRSDIANRGISGDTTIGILERLDRSVPEGSSFCLIQAGVNDLFRGMGPSDVARNYKQILDSLKQRGVRQVMISSVILCDQGHVEVNSRIKTLNSELARLADNQSIRWLDLNSVLAPNGYLELRYTSDGVHLNGEGYRVLASAIAPLLPK